MTRAPAALAIAASAGVLLAAAAGAPAAGAARAAATRPADTRRTATGGQPASASGLVTGTLGITVPPPANLGTVTAGTSSASGSLGSVTVTCQLCVGTWTATVSATGFSDPHTTIPNSDIYYSAGAATISGLVTLVLPGTGYLSGTVTAQSATIVSLGTSTATWNPTLTVTIPMSATAGTYTATITHSVA